jgi:hypothetical protein
MTSNIYFDPSIETITMQLKHFKESASSTHCCMWDLHVEGDKNYILTILVYETNTQEEQDSMPQCSFI